MENALAADPDIADSVVIGLPDDRMGQRVHTIVELRRGAVADPEAISSRLAGRLADFKRPRSFEFVDTMPRQPNGKVLKWQLLPGADPGAVEGSSEVGGVCHADQQVASNKCLPHSGT